MDTVYPSRLPVEWDWVWYKNRWAAASGELVDGDSINTMDFHNRSMREILAIVGALGISPAGDYDDIVTRMDAAVYGDGTIDYIPKWIGTSDIGNSQMTDDGTTVTIPNRLRVNDIVDIYGRGYFDSYVAINTYATIGAYITAGTYITIGSYLTVGGYADITGGLTVRDVSNLMGNTHMDADASIKGAGNIGGDATVSGVTNLLGNTHMDADASIKGDGNIGGNLTASGVSNLLGGVYIDSHLSIKEYLNVGTHIDASGTIKASGNISSGNGIVSSGFLDVAGVSNLYGNIHADSDLSVKANLNVGGNALVSGVSNLLGSVHADGDLSLGADLNVGWNAVISGALTTEGDIYAGNDVDASGSIMASGTIKALGDISTGTGLYSSGTLEVDNWSRLGGVGNNAYSVVDTSGFYRAYGDAAVWDDIRVPLTALQVNPVTSKPDYGIYRDNFYALLFDGSSEEAATFAVQIPHTWKEGSELGVHVHWSPTSANEGTVQWKVEYIIASPSGLFSDHAYVYASGYTDGTENIHYIEELGDIDPSGARVSTMIMGRVIRDAGTDTYADDAAVLEVDFHYQVDTMGSRLEQYKGQNKYNSNYT